MTQADDGNHCFDSLKLSPSEPAGVTVPCTRDILTIHAWASRVKAARSAHQPARLVHYVHRIASVAGILTNTNFLIHLQHHIPEREVDTRD